MVVSIADTIIRGNYLRGQYVMKNPSSDDNGFADSLKQWRKRRRISQLELANLAEVSSRHISFLEKDKAKPSRNMVIKLGMAMRIPPIDVNAGLSAAGFSQAYPKAQLNDKSVVALGNAVQMMLDNQMPWPAVVCEESWDMVKANAAAHHIFELAGLNTHTNLLEAILLSDDPNGAIVNWPEVAHLMLRRLQAEKLEFSDNDIRRRMLQHLTHHPRLENLEFPETSTLDVFIPIKIRINDATISLISMVANFGAVQEITYSGLHVELFFPADEFTKVYLTDLPSS